MRRGVFFSVLITAVCTSCVTLEEGRQINLLSPEQERELGAQVAAEVENTEKLLDDPAVQAYINEIGQRLVAGVERRDVDYQFKVIDAPDTINAFALPGGFMYIYTGLMKLCENEAELASVMAHEIAHVSSYHHGESMTRAYGYQMLMSVVLGRNQSNLARLVADFTGSTGMMYFSRQNEREADAKGMNYMVWAGYNPNAMTSFMQKMMQATEGQARPIPLFSSHPATHERVQNMAAQAAQYPLEVRQNNPVYTERYRELVLNRLGAVPRLEGITQTGAPVPSTTTPPQESVSGNGWEVIYQE